eukprot:TRINITY_DN177_c0_g1_i3.p1 TRINITY_DN177_c0_g1~~TRINITY_DN177_c0_g1_i3.p1  ORF type:complete len:361 (+),score=79.43 TRINITY_DN177_c0_g1_i3:395-1477(+)
MRRPPLIAHFLLNPHLLFSKDDIIKTTSKKTKEKGAKKKPREVGKAAAVKNAVGKTQRKKQLVSSVSKRASNLRQSKIDQMRGITRTAAPSAKVRVARTATRFAIRRKVGGRVAGPAADWSAQQRQRKQNQLKKVQQYKKSVKPGNNQGVGQIRKPTDLRIRISANRNINAPGNRNTAGRLLQRRRNSFGNSNAGNGNGNGNGNQGRGIASRLLVNRRVTNQPRQNQRRQQGGSIQNRSNVNDRFSFSGGGIGKRTNAGRFNNAGNRNNQNDFGRNNRGGDFTFGRNNQNDFGGRNNRGNQGNQGGQGGNRRGGFLQRNDAREFLQRDNRGNNRGNGQRNNGGIFGGRSNQNRNQRRVNY